MKNLTKQLYHYADLSPEAKEKAREWYRNGNDMPSLSEAMNEDVRGLLEEAGYKVNELKVLYSLSHNQGDGASFESLLEKDGINYETKQNDTHYVHSYTMHGVRIDLSTGEETDDDTFTGEMRAIAKKAEKYGYDYIDEENDDEHIAETLEINEYTFTKEGERINPD